MHTVQIKFLMQTKLFFFLKNMPRRTYEAKSQKSAVGFKAEKGRVKFLFCSNALKTRAMKDADFDT